MCNFCILFDFSTARARVEQGVASIDKAPTDIPFLPSQQFNFCPVCGSPRDAKAFNLNASFAKNLRRIRRMRGMTQEQLGEMLGIQRSAVCKYEKGRTRPNVLQLMTICNALDVSPEELL